MPKTQSHEQAAAQAAMDALVAKARILHDLLTHARDINEPDKIIRELQKRIRRTEKLMAKAARKLHKSD